jgi:hypothetical protein
MMMISHTNNDVIAHGGGGNKALRVVTRNVNHNAISNVRLGSDLNVVHITCAYEGV